MASNDYHFVTRWRMIGTVQEVADILGDASDLMRWWPAVYLDVRILEPGDAQGLGRVVSLYTKGWLPYTLRWHFRVTEIRQDGFALEASGDLEGQGNWIITQEGEFVNVIYDWRVKAEKPLLRYFSFLMKPLFAANHRWAMEQGERSLLLEMTRRKMTDAEEQACLPQPPGATFLSRRIKKQALKEA